TSYRLDSMNVASPDLLTLLRWAEQLAAGERCSPWEAWCASSSDAARKWGRIVQAHDLLDGEFAASDGELELSVEEIAAYLDGRLSPLEVERVERAFWGSTAQLAELISAAGFISQPSNVALSQQLASRLLALAPPRPRQVNGKPPKYRLAAVTTETPPAIS